VNNKFVPFCQRSGAPHPKKKNLLFCCFYEFSISKREFNFADRCTTTRTNTTLNRDLNAHSLEKSLIRAEYKFDEGGQSLARPWALLAPKILSAILTALTLVKPVQAFPPTIYSGAKFSRIDRVALTQEPLFIACNLFLMRTNGASKSLRKGYSKSRGSLA